jgi:c-di-GMP-binding flagellar brake protein YcgR
MQAGMQACVSATDWSVIMSLSFLEKTLKIKQRSWQRRHERYRADFPLKATVLQEGGYREIQGRCSDIAHGGLGTVLTAEVPKGEVVSLEFSLAVNTPPLVVRSIVRFRKGFMHGLEFLGITPEQQAAIDAFCQGLSPSG